MARIEATDYYLGYIEGYTASLATLEEIYKEIESIQNKTLGIEFRVGKYLPALTARPAENGAVDYFARLVSECREAIMLVRTSSTIEGDVLPLKRFCQGLVDLRYLVKNARALLKISGDPDREKAEALREAKAYADKNNSPLVTINSWNEWTETSYMQPDDLYGYGYLEAVKRVFKEE